MKTAIILLAGCATLAASQPESFKIKEVFGVSHPNQIVDFDLHDPVHAAHSYYVTGGDGRAVPFQFLRDRKIAIETDLPAFAERAWSLHEGQPPNSFKTGLAVDTTPQRYEITNGLTGVRISRQGLAPIQGIRYRDGVWTGLGPNYLLDAHDARLIPKAFVIRFLERGLLKIVVQADYTFERGYYRCTIELQADQPSILIEEDTDTDLRYQFLISSGLDPDQARYRGHHSTSIANGRMANGGMYPAAHERAAQDAIRDLRFDPPAPSCYTSTDPCIRRMAIWDPWVYDSGWYWQFYNKNAGTDANLFGIFAGRASEALGAAFNGPGVFTTREKSIGIHLEINRRTPDTRTFPRVRFCWGIFTGTKGLDLKDPLEVQGIGRQMNLHAGINLNKVHRYPVGADLPSASRPLYMSGAALSRISARVRADEVYFNHLSQADSTARPLLDFWRDPSVKRREKVVATISGMAHDLLEPLINGGGIYDFRFHYWMGGLEMSRQALWINTILMTPESSVQDKRTARAAAALFSAILWDNDFVPMFDGHGLNMGTANMPVQQAGYRNLYALLLADDPSMRARAKQTVESAIADLHETVSETGAHMGSTHYIDAAMGPLLSTLQQIQAAGAGDPFRTEPRLARFADFYLNLLTPPEVRFGASRKLVSIGDAATESSATFGQLATAFAATDPGLSARLMWAWNRSGAVHSGFHGTTILKIDDALPAIDPQLSDAAFPGWYSVLRNGWRSVDETAMWFVNGDFYRDHAHEDNGNVAIYALGAPLSVDWGSMYDPPTPGAFMHNAPIPESRLKVAWSTLEPPLDNMAFRWGGAIQEAFASSANSGYSRAAFHLSDGLTWRRSVYSIHPDASRPILLIRDQFEGPGAASEKILSLNVMAKARQPLTQPQPLDAGVHGFRFTGQFSVDVDVYLANSKPAEALIRHWGHHWAPSQEQSEFFHANGRAFEEQQDILRFRTAGESLLMLLPHRQGDKRAVSVTQEGPGIAVKTGAATTWFDESSWRYQGPQGVFTGTFDQKRL